MTVMDPNKNKTTQKHEHHPEYKNGPASPYSASEWSLFFTGYSPALTHSSYLLWLG